MSYQVLARKWRPRNFSTLVGQEHVVRALTHALTEQRLHHAYLFTGTRGVGKTTLARILAKSLNCETGITATPCGRCSSCLEIDAGRFVDLLEVDAATNTRVDEMRQLLENAVYAPTRGRFKVYVIDEVHMLSTSAFNAMLKTLEEPPEHVKFILATTDPQKIPVTVLSRCLQFNLKQMPLTAITAHLAHILDAEAVPHEPAALALVARSAGGSMRDALSLLDQAIAHGAGRVEEGQVRSMLGAVDQDHLYTILQALQAGDAAALLQVAADLAVRSLSFGTALQDLAALLTRVQIVQCVPGALDDDAPDKALLLEVAAGLSAEFIQLAYQIVIIGRQELSTAPDEYAGFVMTLLRLHAFRPTTVAEIVRSAVQPRPPVSAAAAAVALPRAAASGSGSLAVSRSTGAESAFASPVAPSPLALAATMTSVHWPELLAALPLSGLARELALNCELRQLDEGLCILCLPQSQAHLQMKPSPDRLQQALCDHLGRAVTVRIELGSPEGDTPAVAAGRERQARQARAVDAIEQDIFVRDAIDLLGASVVASTIKPIV
ncbi:MAG: DNA polymerase III subunit gamma/tau [Dechloromonas sp.]|nr:DNA polymerase III subunit gamma/tau [Dechloromonas sp.]